MAISRYLIAGLGNPGREYHLTRHNIGFYFLGHLAALQGWRLDSLKMQGLHCQGRAFGGQLFLVQPQTFMNRSGTCIRAFLDYYKIPQEHLLVIHDDLDLLPGRIKMVARGGAGGHNGIRSIIQHLGNQDFARMKVGIGRPVSNPEGNGPRIEQFVLSTLSAVELALFDQQRDLMVEAVESFVREGIDTCMNRINGR